MNGKIYLRRNRIQFERLPFPNDGNYYSNQMAHAWESAAIRSIEKAGYEADVEAVPGKDHHKFLVWVEPTEEKYNAADEEYEIIGFAKGELTAAMLVGDRADAAGLEAARRFADGVPSANPDWQGAARAARR